MSKEQWDYLDQVAVLVAKGDLGGYGPLSTGEQIYVAFAANCPELAQANGYTMAEAIARLGDEWTAALVERWRYRGNPKKWK